MPVDFLTREQERAYGRYDGEPSDVELQRFFYLDDADRALVAERRGDHNRLGWGVQLGTVRYLGAFLDDPTAVPPGVVAHVAAQLAIADPSCLVRYRDGETRWDHTAEIRWRYGYRPFVDQPGHLRFVRWLYARAWTGAERPSALFDQAVARLVAGKVLLPGMRQNSERNWVSVRVGMWCCLPGSRLRRLQHRTYLAPPLCEEQPLVRQGDRFS